MISWLTKQSGNRLREERKRLEKNQGEAAEIAGVRREQWSHYEGGAAPSSDVLVRLVEAEFDVNYVLGGARVIGAESGLPKRERLLLERYRDMDEEGRLVIDRAAAMEAVRTAAGKPPEEPSPPPVVKSRVTFAGNVKAKTVAGRDMTINAPAKKPKR